MGVRMLSGILAAQSVQRLVEHGTTGGEQEPGGAEDDKKDGPEEEAKCPSEPVPPGSKCSPEAPGEEPGDH